MLALIKANQLNLFSALVALVSLVSILYILIAQPAYLRKSAEGVPFFTPPLLHPDSGEPVTIDELIRHYKSASQ